MTVHPIDTEEARFGAEAHLRYGGGGDDLAENVLALLDALAAAEHRIARLEVQSDIRGRAVVMYRERAREAEAERDEWRQTALDERAATLDALKQIKAREARIKAVRDVLDQAEASINRHPAYTFSGQRMDPIVNGADIRRALDT